MPCPRCKGKTRFLAGTDEDGTPLYKDPFDKKGRTVKTMDSHRKVTKTKVYAPCLLCGGYGLIPNVGPIVPAPDP